MNIPTYQIHNVMKVYSRQISQSRLIDREKTLGKKPGSVDKINISAEGKRQGIINKVASDIVDRITRFGPQEDVDHEIVGKLEQELGQPVSIRRHGNGDFVFNTIDQNNNKVTSTLSIDDSDFVLKRLEQLAREAVDKNMAS